MTADLEFHWWMTFSSCCYIFWLYKLQQKPPKHPKWSQPARSLHEPAGKLMYWTRGVQRSLGCWMCGEIAFFIVEKPWLQSCFWDAHSWVARAIALLLPHQGTARPRTTRRPWLQRPQKSQKTKSTGVLTLFEFDWLDWSKNQDTNFYSKITKTQTEESKNCRNSQTSWIDECKGHLSLVHPSGSLAVAADRCLQKFSDLVARHLRMAPITLGSKMGSGKIERCLLI